MYECINCNYTTTKKSDWNKHILTKKHKKQCSELEIKPVKVRMTTKRQVQPRRKKETKFICEMCKNEYKYRSGLSRHKCKKSNNQKVIFNEETITESENRKQEKEQNVDKQPAMNKKETADLNEALKNTILETLENKVIKKQQEQISDLQLLLQKSIENTKETVAEMLPRIGNTTNINNQMTVNIFLNEECRDAVNLTDFLHNLDLSLDDLIYTSKNGYTKGIANIFVKKLQNLKPTERPIHCSDRNELQFYVKHQDNWEKDNENVKIDKSIEHITKKQIQQIKEWERDHPKWQHTDKDAKLYIDLIKQTVGGLNEHDRNKNFEEIKKELGINVDLNDLNDFINNLD